MKRVVITGATGGVGQALVAKLHAQGYALLCLARDQKGLEKLTAELDADRTSILAVPLESVQLGQRLTDHLVHLAWDELYALVNLAALSIGGTINDVSLSDWEYSMQVNVTAPMQLIQTCAPKMIGSAGGVILNVSSPVALVGSGKVSYAASKGALHGLTMSCAKTYGPLNIRVNTVLPGPTITKMTSTWSEERRASIAQESFLGRLSTPEEVADMLSLLLRDEARYMTGALVDLTAGSMWTG